MSGAENGIESRIPFYDGVVVLGKNFDTGAKFYEFPVEGEERVACLTCSSIANVLAGAMLLKDGKTKRLILSTGYTRPEGKYLSEAASMRAFLFAVFPELRGKRDITIEIEERSYDTLSNAKEVGTMLGATDTRMALVTTDYHLKRSELLMRRHMFGRVAKGFFFDPLSSDSLIGTHKEDLAGRTWRFGGRDIPLTEIIEEYERGPHRSIEKRKEFVATGVTRLHLERAMQVTASIQRQGMRSALKNLLRRGGE